MSTQLKIVGFTLLVTGFYTYVGAIVPQMEAHPPKSTEIAEDLGPEELAAAGRQIFFGKGTCALCHTLGGKGERCPDLEGIGAQAANRVEGTSVAEYLAQSLYDPNAYLVEGYTPTMPRIDRPPVGLEAREISAVIAFLQSLGGEITVTPSSSFTEAVASGSSAGGGETPPAPGTGELPAQALITKYGCGACHDFESPARRLGPSLHDLGARESKASILHSIVDPDALVVRGDPPYPPGLMGATLEANGFYSSVSLAELNSLADYLAALKGGGP